jgi:hypothetical protein
VGLCEDDGAEFQGRHEDHLNLKRSDSFLDVIDRRSVNVCLSRATRSVGMLPGLVIGEWFGRVLGANIDVFAFKWTC